MKKLTVSVTALVIALAAAPVVAHADNTPGWYAGAGVGATFPVDPTLRQKTTHNATDENANIDALGDGGYAWANGLRLEGEFFHNQNNTTGVPGFANGGGHVSNNALFGNVYYDIHTNTRYTPYIGAGVGPDFINVKSVGAPAIGYLKGDTLDAGYQAIAGVSAQLDTNWAVTADYRYIASFDPKVDSTAGGQGRMDNASHNIILGVRYSFCAPPPPPAAPMRNASAPMVTTHTATKQTVAPVGQNYTVFFDFNKSILTPEAKRIIASAAQAYSNGGYAMISITGHTDTVGSDAYNDKLSEARALAVKSELIRLGVASANMKEAGVGKEGLLVPTADGVREAQNRRAEIVLSK